MLQADALHYPVTEGERCANFSFTIRTNDINVRQCSPFAATVQQLDLGLRLPAQRADQQSNRLEH
jgi:hypothetical protein